MCGGAVPLLRQIFFFWHFLSRSSDFSAVSVEFLAANMLEIFIQLVRDLKLQPIAANIRNPNRTHIALKSLLVYTCVFLRNFKSDKITANIASKLAIYMAL